MADLIDRIIFDNISGKHLAIKTLYSRYKLFTKNQFNYI